MADATATVDIAALHAAIKANLAAQFPQILDVDYYVDERDELTAEQLPALFFEISEIQASPNHDPGSDQLAIMVRFEARLIWSFSQSLQARLNVRVLAANIAAWMHSVTRWPDPQNNDSALPGQAGKIQIIGVYPDDFNPSLDKYHVQRIEWQQLFWLGESVWADLTSGTAPSKVFASFAPDIGPANAGEYVQVNE